MSLKEVLTLFEYNYWANRKVLESAERLNSKQLTEPIKYGHGSLFGILVHVFGVEWLWGVRCQEGLYPKSLPSENEFPTLKSLSQRWLEEEEKMLKFLKRLQYEDLEQAVRYFTTEGEHFENSLWQILIHIINHGTHHRSQAKILLKNYDCSPGDIDFIVFLRAQSEIK